MRVSRRARAATSSSWRFVEFAARGEGYGGTDRELTGPGFRAARLAGGPGEAYPKDNTSGCTKEAEAFRDLQAEFAACGAVILGCSKDSLKSHERFAEKLGLNFPLLSDETTEVQQLYGVWHLKRNYGREYMGTVRSTFLLDKSGVVRKIWRKVKVKGHAEEVLAALKALQDCN